MHFPGLFFIVIEEYGYKGRETMREKVFSCLEKMCIRDRPQVKTTDANGIDHFRGHQKISEELAGGILRRLKFDNETIRQVKKPVSYTHLCV